MTSHLNHPSPTYTALAALGTKLQTSKIKERRQASKELLEKLSDPSTLRQLEWEAQCRFDNAVRRTSRGGVGRGAADQLAFPRERVSILFRNLLDAAILSSSWSISGETAGSSGRQKKTANGTGFIKHSCKFTAEDVLFPHKVFLRIDGTGLEHADGGYGVAVSREEDWKSRPRYGFHLDTAPAPFHSGSFNATYYRSHEFSDDDRGTMLSAKEILSTVNYCVSCLNDDDCCDLAEVELMQWLAHICARPDYVALIPVQSEMSYILHEISTRFYREFQDGAKERLTGSFAGLSPPKSGASRRSKFPIKQECLLACAKCLSGLVYNCTTRLGIGMQLYLRPIVELVAWWAHSAWTVQSGGGLTTTAISSTQSAYRTNLRTETDILSLLPYLYSSVTHLIAAHPEQSVAVLSERGHALLRMARKNYLRSATNPQMRDALIEYISAHLLVSETSGRLYGLPEGDVGPLVVYSGEDEDEKEGNMKVSSGATLNKKAIDSLLEMVRNEKVWESLFLASGGEQDALVKKNKALHRRNSLSRNKRKRNARAIFVEGGGTWTPLTRKQRRYLELECRLLRLSQRLHLAEAEALGDGSSDSLESLIEEAAKMTQHRSDIENGEIDIDTGFNSTSLSSHVDSRYVASNEALAGTPWVKTVCRHLYKLNPKLEKTASLGKDTSSTQLTLETVQTCGGERDLFTQKINFREESPGSKYTDVQPSYEQWLLGLCPILRALVAENAHAATDPICPTTTATLQLICASAESFPRGECWSSSTRRHWSTTLDESVYPGGASARVRERNGSSPADAASVVYLLGTTLECCGGSSGDVDVQVWTLMALLKMAESSAVICAREGVLISPEPLRVAWQYVWRVLFRYDLLYSSYTAGAYANNAGELVLQLLTQIIRYQCTGQPSLSPVKSGHSSDGLPFTQGQSKDIFNLPVFDKPTAILTGTSFELLTACVQYVLESVEVTFDASTVIPDFSNAVHATRDRKWLVSCCLKFIEYSLLKDNAHSKVQRSFLPFVATCLASLISGGDVGGNSSFELNNLTVYSVTEDTEPCIGKGPENDSLDYGASIFNILDMLWRKAVFPYIHPGDRSLPLEYRILQGRGAVLNQYSDAIQERTTLSFRRKIDTTPFVHKRILGDMSFERIKCIFDELLFGLCYGSDEEDESMEEEIVSESKRAIKTPRVTGCLMLLMTIVLSSSVTLQDASKHIADIATDTIIRALDHQSEVLKALILEPPDVLATINHLDGIVRVLTHIVAAGDGTPTIPNLFADQLKDIFSTFKSLLRNNRNSMYTSNSSPTKTTISEQPRRPEYDSDDDGFTSQIPIQRLTQSPRFSDDSDGFMEDVAEAGPSRNTIRTPLKRSAPPTKCRRIESTSISGKQDRSVATKSIDCQGAWACASLMILLKPSIECLEIITAHLVWPEDCDNENGYRPVSKSLDPSGAYVCASLITQKLVIQRQHLQSNLVTEDKDDQQSAIVLCIEAIFQARRWSTPSSKYIMWGLGFLSDLVELGDRSECRPSICATESKFVVDALYPEGNIQDNQDNRTMRQLKKMLNFRNLHRAGSLYVSTYLFLRGQENLHQALDEVFVNHFIKPSFRHIDEGIRSLACDALGVALGGFSDQKMIVSEMHRNILPPLKSEKKFGKWVNSLVDPKMPVDLSQLEQSALNDARLSFEYHAINCIGLIAGSTTDEDTCIDMVWELIDLNACEPAMGLLCHRACERAALMLGFHNVSDFFFDLAPHLLVKWIESRRSLRQFPLLLTSPFALRGACRYFPNEVLDMIVLEGGYDDRFWNSRDAFIINFIQSFADVLVPAILLTKSNETAAGDDPINTSQYISDFTEILIESTSDESFAKILRHHICDIYSFIFVLRSDTNQEVHDLCDNACSHLTRRISETHIQRDGAKQAFMILRGILKLHATGISVAGQKQLHLTPSNFIEGMKSVSKQIIEPSNSAFLESAGSSLTELFIVSGFWLSSNGTTVRQREKFWKPLSLLCNILQDHLREATIAPQEVCFCIRFLISTALDPTNRVICPSLLASMKEILRTLFFEKNDNSLADKITATIHKLCLALLAIHRRSFFDFLSKCNSSLLGMQYNNRCGLALLANIRDAGGSWYGVSNETAPFKECALSELIISKANFDEMVSSDIMVYAYDCLEIIVNNGKILLEDILGAEDIVHQQQATQKRTFGNVNKKYEIDSLFNPIRSSETRSLLDESKHFIEIMVQYPISDKKGTCSTISNRPAPVQSVDALARLLALQRLAKSIEINNVSVLDESDIRSHVLESLFDVCQSRDSNEAKVISSRCLGALDSCWISRPSHFDDAPCRQTVDDPLKAMKTKVLSMIGQFLLHGSPAVSLIAMKTAKSLLSLTHGKECWKLIDDEHTKGVLNPFVPLNHSLLQKEQIVLSTNYIDNLKMIGASSQVDKAPWCWNDGLWSGFTDVGADSTENSWIKNIVCAMIICCFNNDERNPDCEFIYTLQGLCAKEASLAACVFPGIIFLLLESENRAEYERTKYSVRDTLLCETAIGSPTSNINAAITKCFSRVLSTCHAGIDSMAAPYAVTVVLDTLETLHHVTMKRFLTSMSHVRNCTDVPKHCSTTNTKTRKLSGGTVHEFDLPPKWRGVPYGVVLRLDGLDVARACLRSKKYYSAIYFCEMAMQNISGVGNFFEQIASDSITITDQAIIGDISGFGIEDDQKRSILDLALIAKDILVSCLSELQQKDELQGMLSQSSALSLKQNITTLKSVHECHNEEALPLLIDLDVELQTLDEFGIDASRHVARVTTCLEDLGLEHVKQLYLRGIGSMDNMHSYEKWFEDALHKTCQWDKLLLHLPDDGPQLSRSTEGFASTKKIDSLPCDLIATSTVTPNFYEAVYRTLQRFVKKDVPGGYSAIAQARQTVLNDLSLLEGSESKLKSMHTHLSKLNVLGSLAVVGKTMEGKSPLQDALKQLGFVDESGNKDLKSFLLSSDDTSIDILEQSMIVNGATLRLLRLDFSVKEVLLEILLRMFPQDRETISEAIIIHVYKSCRIYRDIGRPDAAKKMLSRLRTLLEVFQKLGMTTQSSNTGVLPLMLRLEDAKVMSCQTEFNEAIIHCKTIVNYLSAAGSLDTDFTNVLARTLLLGGCLMAHEHVDAVDVMESFFERAAKISHQAHRKSSDSSSLIQATAAYFKLGEFASSIYSAVDARVSSESWKQRKANLSEMEKEAANLEVERADLEKKLKKSKKQVDIDAFNAAHIKLSTITKEKDLEGREIKGNENSLNKYLRMALESYCYALKLCPTTATSIDCSKHVFQLIRLWFRNCNRPDTANVANDLLKIPSHHFVPLTYQVFSRIDENDRFFQNTLQELVIKICTEHPYHGISQLIALSNGNLTNKVNAARSIMQQIKNRAPDYVVALIDTYGSLMNAYIDLAMLNTSDIPKKQTKGLTFSKYKLKLDVCLSGGRRGSKSLSLANAPAIITKPPSIRPDMQYGNGSDDPIGSERVVGFESTFELAPSGLHRPAIVVCLGSQGGRFKQLVKGEDDMRQDAIMQQVFGTMNNLLKKKDVRWAEPFHNMSTSNSCQELKVITYGIIPLSPTAGVLEWVNDTDSFGTFMTGSSKNVGALSKYYPGEWGNPACQKYYANGHEHKSQEQRRKDFDIICKNISPGIMKLNFFHFVLSLLDKYLSISAALKSVVFRFFFIEKFSYSMEAWHSARTAYTRSCAVNSIVGHILGIGDRHTSNILVHTKTGELVHIDFGYVFEQGKLLRTPETVPFRLTRNIIDGMGPCGTDGVFSKSAEATLSVLRKNSDTLLTILSAIVSDPLYRWSLAPSNIDENGNDAAERAMTKVHDKLQGYEDGTSGMHTVAGQVKFLINEARDPNNLCNLYSGWQPWI